VRRSSPAARPLHRGRREQGRRVSSVDSSSRTHHRVSGRPEVLVKEKGSRPAGGEHGAAVVPAPAVAPELTCPAASARRPVHAPLACRCGCPRARPPPRLARVGPRLCRSPTAAPAPTRLWSRSSPASACPRPLARDALLAHRAHLPPRQMHSRKMCFIFTSPLSSQGKMPATLLSMLEMNLAMQSVAGEAYMARETSRR
jgi:hypothetical protein